MHARKKHNAGNQFYSLCALRFTCACIASVALRMTAWKLTFKSVLSIQMVAALFRRSARVGL